MHDESTLNERMDAWARSQVQKANRGKYFDLYKTLTEEEAGTYEVETDVDKEGNPLVRVKALGDGKEEGQDCSDTETS